MARRPYTTKFRPFKDSDLEVDILWYPADPKRGTLPFPSAVYSLDWQTDPWAKTGVGEVYGASRKFNRARKRIIPPPPHVCGTQLEFFEGEHFDPSRPPTIYNGQQLPICCMPAELAVGGIVFGGRALVRVPGVEDTFGGIAFNGTATVSVPANVAARGGVAFGGRALVEVPIPQTARGGIAFSGRALVEVPGVTVARGGIAFNGTATVDVPANVAARGGVAFGGRATVDTPGLVVSRGGAVFGGAAQIAAELLDSAEGGIAFNGTATVDTRGAEVARGGVVFGGTAYVGVPFPVDAEGGIAFAGTAAVDEGHEATAAGGIAFAGTADVDVVPVGPNPGPTCATAAELPFDETTPVMESTGIEQWWRCGTLAAGSYTIDLDVLTGSGTALVLTGADCGSLTGIGVMVGTSSFSFVLGAPDTVFIDVSGFTPITYTLHIG